jgi:hypothetical protein
LIVNRIGENASVFTNIDHVSRGFSNKKLLKHTFLKYFPKARFILHTSFYFPWETDKMNSYGKEIISLFDWYHFKTPDGREFKVKNRFGVIPFLKTVRKTGDKVTLYYMSDKPEEIREKSFLDLWGYGLIFLCLGIIFLFGASILFSMTKNLNYITLLPIY